VPGHSLKAGPLAANDGSLQAASAVALPGTPDSSSATQGNNTLISDDASVWLSTDGGSAWTKVTVPVDHGVGDSVSGVSFDGSGLLVVRPGRTAGDASDGIAYFLLTG
jgi:hypothetical protein